MMRAPLIYSEVTRLLVDLNRSPGNSGLFSDISRQLPKATRDDILTYHYFPHRQRIERWIAARIRARRAVLHVAVHSFTPVLAGMVRSAELGLLYDPRRDWETELCRHWQQALRETAPTLRVRRNYPYRGISDGLTRHLRTLFPLDAYAGIELEINQAVLTKTLRTLTTAIASALRTAS
jgi:predicted N-formylglutamate amidohydrolase